MKFNIYSRVTKPGENKLISFDDVVDIIKSDQLKEHTDYLRQEPDKDARTEYKKLNFPGVIFQGEFSHRAKEKLVKSSGLATIDIDDYDGDIQPIKDKIMKDPFVYCAFISPSGGLKVVVRIPEVRNDEEYKTIYENLLIHYAQFSPKGDISNKDISRLCFLSYDPDIYVNKKAKVFDKVLTAEEKTETTEKKTGDTSRSGQEMNKVIKLVARGYTKEKVFKEMSGSEKWSKSSQAYKDLTYEKAEKYVKEQKEKKKITYQKVSLEDCKKVLRSWLHIKDEEVLDVVFAFSIAEKIPGDPLWLFLIAPPGGCKTEVLRALNGEEYYHLSDLTSKTFISGLMIGHGEQRRKIEDLLPQLNKKVLVMKDFTTILEKNKDERREIIAQLREIYDGSFAKKVGTIDEKIEYDARFGMLAGVTPIIDKHWKIMQQLGERFLKYRWDEEEDATTRRAEQNEGKEKPMRKEIKDAVMGFVTNLEIPKEINLPDNLVEPLIKVAKFLAICRTPITIQSNRSDFYFDFVPTPERPTRLVKQLKKTSKCIAIVRGHKEVQKEDVATAIKVALSTSPQDRLDVMRALKTKQHATLDGCTISQIKSDVNLPETSLRNICMQLEMLGLVIITKVSRETGSGYQEHVQYSKLSKKVTALYPLTFLEGSEK